MPACLHPPHCTGPQVQIHCPSPSEPTRVTLPPPFTTPSSACRGRGQGAAMGQHGRRTSQQQCDGRARCSGQPCAASAVEPCVASRARVRGRWRTHAARIRGHRVGCWRPGNVCGDLRCQSCRTARTMARTRPTRMDAQTALRPVHRNCSSGKWFRDADVVGSLRVGHAPVMLAKGWRGRGVARRHGVGPTIF